VERWAAIRLFAMDVDGTLTDGTVAVSSDGTETKSFSVLDGLGIVRLLRSGVSVALISGRFSGATVARAAELGIPHVIQERIDKLAALQELAGRLGFEASQCAYIGDDDFDAPAMRWAGVGASVPGAMPAALDAAAYVTARAPGRGAVREVCDLILAARGGGRRPAPP
jgi:3-deoxy-D-manno-octulosonate 8-phosphate phosphatase (KDO 8-P phosphatase)